jgi:hypothetical protein
MDLWATVLLITVMTGLMGWSIVPFTTAVTWYCDWQDGNDINWGLDTAFTVAVPFAWLFSIFEILMLYAM